jgi:hypothetical protein
VIVMSMDPMLNHMAVIFRGSALRRACDLGRGTTPVAQISSKRSAIDGTTRYGR